MDYCCVRAKIWGNEAYLQLGSSGFLQSKYAKCSMLLYDPYVSSTIHVGKSEDSEVPHPDRLCTIDAIADLLS
jgi:hypothetical protein